MSKTRERHVDPRSPTSKLSWQSWRKSFCPRRPSCLKKKSTCNKKRKRKKINMAVEKYKNYNKVNQSENKSTK